MATTITKVIDPDGTGDYTSLSAWAGARARDLVSADEIEVASCISSSGGDDTGGGVSLTGWTTDATRYIQITVPTSDRHAGVWDDAKYVYQAQVQVGISQALSGGANHLYIEGLQINFDGVTNWRDDCVGILFNELFSATSGDYIRVASECILKGTFAGGGNIRWNGIEVRRGGSGAVPTAKTVLRNCLAYDFDTTDSVGFDFNNLDPLVYVYNCTAVDCTSGFETAGPTYERTILKNCLADGCTDGFVTYSSWGTGTDYNASDIASDAPGGNSQNGTATTFEVRASDDFHLGSGDTVCLDNGTDLSADSDHAFDNDIDDDTRSRWSIGADDGPAVAGTRRVMVVS